MRIAQVSPLAERVPPKLYGGTERIVAYLCDALVDLGHDVTLFASGDSVTKAKLAPGWPQALRLDPTIVDYLGPQTVMLELLAQRAAEFDVIHMHMDWIAFPLMRRLGVPYLATLHGRLDIPELKRVYEVFSDAPVVSISNSQREPLAHANYVQTVYHGLPEKFLQPGFGGGGYLAFLGRISPEKGPDAAIRIAAEAGMKLKIAAKVDRADADYFNARIKPLLGQNHVEFIGEINESQKSEFLGNAAGLLFPIAWREPFGLAMIEAMACGTPVIAMRNGSVPEIVDEGVTGFVVETEAEAAAAAKRLKTLDRALIRRVFDKRFTARRMAEDYVGVYHRLIAARSPLRAVV